MRTSTEVKSQIENVTILLRYQRSRWPRRALQFFTAVLGFSLHAFGTVIIVSMTLFEVADAIRVVVAVAVNAGFGLLVGYWSIS